MRFGTTIAGAIVTMALLIPAAASAEELSLEEFKAAVTDKPWAQEPQSRKADPLEDGLGVYVPGLSIKVDLAQIVKPADESSS